MKAESKMELLVFVLLGLLFAQQVMHGIERQKLVNKIMSRDYFTYKTAETLKAEEKSGQLENVEPAEDLRTLQEFRM